jgi:hypothetical protein
VVAASDHHQNNAMGSSLLPQAGQAIAALSQNHSRVEATIKKIIISLLSQPALSAVEWGENSQCGWSIQRRLRTSHNQNE